MIEFRGLKIEKIRWGDDVGYVWSIDCIGWCTGRVFHPDVRGCA